MGDDAQAVVVEGAEAVGTALESFFVYAIVCAVDFFPWRLVQRSRVVSAVAGL